MRIEYHPETVSDLNQGIAYYEQFQPGLGIALREEVYAAIERIRVSPCQWRAIDGGIRQCLVRRFPWSIYYRVLQSDAVIRILVIRHQRRHPETGFARR